MKLLTASGMKKGAENRYKVDNENKVVVDDDGEPIISERAVMSIVLMLKQAKCSVVLR